MQRTATLAAQTSWLLCVRRGMSLLHACAGMMGNVVAVVLDVRPCIPIRTTAYCTCATSGPAVAEHLAQLRGANDAVFAILVPDRAYAYVELRNKVSASTPHTRPRAVSADATLSG